MPLLKSENLKDVFFMQYDTLVILNLLNSLILKFSLFGLSDQIPRGKSITLLRSLYIDTILTQYIL